MVFMLDPRVVMVTWSSHSASLAERPEDVVRAVTRRAGFLDRTSVFDDDRDLHERVERLFVEMVAVASYPPASPSREAMVALLGTSGIVGR